MKIKHTSQPITRWTFAVLATLFFVSCKKDFSEQKSDEQKIAESSKQTSNESSSGRLGLSYRQGTIILGEQLKNPYTPTLMAKAWENLQRKGVTSNYPVNIRRTHLYVKFKPKSWDEYDDLKEDSLLQISDIPYDYDILQNGNFYHDLAVVDTLPTYQYASVPVNFDFNDTIEYEILSPLYIPERDNSLLGASNQNELLYRQIAQ